MLIHSDYTKEEEKYFQDFLNKYPTQMHTEIITFKSLILSAIHAGRLIELNKAVERFQ